MDTPWPTIVSSTQGILRTVTDKTKTPGLLAAGPVGSTGHATTTVLALDLLRASGRVPERAKHLKNTMT